MAENAMPTTLPLDSYEEAIPLLRRPYLASQVYGKVQTTPKNKAEPCVIALYTIGETLFDRFNLLCGGAWDHGFEAKREAKYTPSNSRGTRYYCEVEATIVLFGLPNSDIGEGVAATRAGAEMNARAQAYKRAARKFGPGQCLYACDEILMFRGGEGADRLCVPAEGDDDRWSHPFFDPDGNGRRYVRERYSAWLGEYGKDIYGEPLDHLALAAVLETSPKVTSVAVPAMVPREEPARTRGPAPKLTAAPSALAPSGSSSQNGGAAEAERNGSATPPAASKQRSGSRPQAADYLPMADHPAPIGAIRAAAAHGYGQMVARALCDLVRSEGQDEHVSHQQLGTVENWLTMLNSLSISEEAVIAAVAHNANKRMSQERRQALFSRWLSSKAGGEPPKEPKEGEQPPTADPTGEQPPPPADTATPGKEDPAELAQAMNELQDRMGDHNYGEQPVARLATLALGRGPNSRVKMADLGTTMVRTLVELLDCAAALGWDSAHLDRELLEAHGSNQHATASGRFSAFANTLKDLAESRTASDE